MVWGRAPVAFDPPAVLARPAFTLVQSAAAGLSVVLGQADAATCAHAACTTFPATRAFMMLVALLMLLALWLLLKHTRVGLVIQAALTHPEMAEALGHDVPRVFMLVFGAGCALAGLAGVIGGTTFVTEPAMAAAIGPILFVVVVVGGTGSLVGAFVGALLIGLLQTVPLTVDKSLADAAHAIGWQVTPDSAAWPLMKLTLAQVAPILPYLLLVLILIFRPRGLFGTRERASAPSRMPRRAAPRKAGSPSGGWTAYPPDGGPSLTISGRTTSGAGSCGAATRCCCWPRRWCSAAACRRRC